MAGLTRTALTAAQKVAVSAEALARQGSYGEVTRLARAFGVSRPTVYAASTEAGAALARYFDEGATKAAAVQVTVDESHLRRSVVALRTVGPLSLRHIQDLLPILFPGVKPSFGTIQAISAEAERRATVFNEEADLSGISAGALDELYSQGDPVLAGIGLDVGYLFALSHRETRSGADWAEVLRAGKERGLSLDVVVKDAALGIASGVRDVFPEAEQRDDCFHAHYEMGKVARTLERRAYNAIAREQEAEEAVRKVRRTGRGNRAQALGKLRSARQKCEGAIAAHDRFEGAVQQAQEAMEFVDLDSGRLRTPEDMKVALEDAADQMQINANQKARKIGTYIRNRAPGLVLYVTALATQFHALFPRYGQDAVQLACVIWRLIRDLQNHRWPWDRSKDERHLIAAFAYLRNLLGTESGDTLLAQVEAIMQRRHRASSAIEGFNAALRPYLYVHRGVSSGFLELFRAYFNLRTRRWGRFKNTSAHGLLTGEDTTDWLALLGYPPANTLPGAPDTATLH